MTPDRNPVLAASCLLAALLLTLFASCDSTPDKRADAEDWVAIGDRVHVTEPNHPDVIGADVYVDIDGTVQLPEIGTVQVAGRTASEIRDLLMERYGPYHDDLDIQVEITTGVKHYFVLGEVANQGMKPLTVDITVFEAVREASPNPNSANLGRVKLIRAAPHEPQVWTIDVSEFDALIQERDIIHVPAIDEPEPEPTPAPMIVPDYEIPILGWLVGGRA